MTSVAWTDAIQCSILFMALVFMPILAAAKWGGFESIGGDGNADCDTLRERYMASNNVGYL
jgi:Na+/proline symporter